MRRRLGMVLAAGATVVVLALGAANLVPRTAAAADGGSGPVSSVVPALPRDVGWRPCDDPTLAYYRMECAVVSVPLDYQQPSGRHISLALSRIVHTVPDREYQGVMLVNPGGPGGSGLTLAVIGKLVPHGVGGAYDWIGFDPRGVGSSSPQLTCDPDYYGDKRPDYVPTTAASEKFWLARAKAFATACGRAQASLLAHMTTVDSAKDMDSIRNALGVDQINFYGFSYGTYLGQVYATLYPQRVRRMVLDSIVNPQTTWYQSNLDQDLAFERNMKIWFGWVAKYDAVYHLGASADDVQRLFYREQRNLQVHRAGAVGPAEWNDIFLQAGYYRVSWQDLASSFADWVHHGYASALVTEYRNTDLPGNDNEIAVYDAVECTDMAWPTDWAQWRADNWRSYRVAPVMTWNNVWYNAPCLFWPAKPGVPVVIDGTKAPPALFIDETLDAATPFPGSLEARKLFPNAGLIAEPGGTTHADSLFGDHCVDDQVAAYLLDGTLPARRPGNGPDSLCAPLPDPDPTIPALLQQAIAGTRTQWPEPDSLDSLAGG